MTKLHGVLRQGEGTGELRFGIHKLLHRIGDRSNGSDAEPWPNIWMDGLFGKARYKFHRLCWDALHAAARLEGTLRDADKVVLDPTSDSSAKLDVTAAVTKDATLYLDVILFYFRILADCLAMVVPNLYGQDGRAIKSKARDSFRAHRRWFERNSDFDPAYAHILKEDTGWFDQLAGEDGGWRDDLVHRAGRWQIAIVYSPEVSLHVGINRPAHPPYPNLIDELREAVRSFCVYLDLVTVHFANRINLESAVPLFDPTNPSQWACHFIHGGSEGLWILPEITEGPAPPVAAP